jgi:tetratricopeptide (TPR) repeat protein
VIPLSIFPLKNEHCNEKYNIFLTYFEKFNDLTNDELFLMANAYLGSGKPEKAIPILLNIAADNTNIHKESADWYLALAYLKQGNISECRNWLEKIKAHTTNVYKKRANDLAQKLQ